MKINRITSLLMFVAISIYSFAYDFSAVNEDGVTIYYRVLSLNPAEIAVTYGGDNYTSPTLYNASTIKIPKIVEYGNKTFSVSQIDGYAFTNSLASFIELPESISIIGDNAFQHSNITEINLPCGLLQIGNYAFARTQLDEITIPSNVQRFQAYVFEQCENLKTVNFEDGNLVDIPSGTFKYCTSLENINLPRTLKYIDAFVFDGCTSLKEIYLPRNITLLGYRAFENCSNLKDIYLYSTPPYTSAQSWSSLSGKQYINFEYNENFMQFSQYMNIKLHVPSTYTDIYKETPGWKEFANIIPFEIYPETINLDVTDIELHPRDTLELKATITPDDVTQPKITWTSSDSIVATVDSTGVVVARSAGTTYIKAKTVNDLAESCLVTVTFVPVENIVMPENEKTILLGNTATIEAYVLPENATYNKLEWTSSDPEKVSVDSFGMIIAKGLGEVEITAKASNDDIAVCKIFVIPILATEVVLNEHDAILNLPGQTLQLEATVDPENTTFKQLTWSTSDESVATVDENGLVKALRFGEVTITVKTINDISDECHILIRPILPESITLDEEHIVMKYVGANHQFSATILPENTFDKTVTWQSSNPACVYVSEEGNIKAMSKGVALITACCGDIETTCTVIVDAIDGPNALTFSDRLLSESDPTNFVALGTSGWEANAITLTDAQPFYSPYDFTANAVTYTRTFSNTGWQAMYVPFNITFEEWADKGIVAKINNVHQYDDDDDGVFDRTIIEFKRVTSGELKPNTPYVFKALVPGEVSFSGNNKTIKATPDGDGYVDCASTEYLYTLSGNYQPKTDMYESGAYALKGGAFVKADVEGLVLTPFRIYLSITERTGNYHQAAGANRQPQKISIMVDGELTGIEGIIIDSADDCYYDLMGRPVINPTKGVYIKNGTKVLIK